MQPAGLRTFEGRDPSKVLKYSSENDPKFDAETTRAFLESLGPVSVTEVPR